MTPPAPSAARPEGATASVSGGSGTCVVVVPTATGYDVLAGTPEDATRRTVLHVSASALAAFAREVVDHLDHHRPAERVQVAYEEPFPVAVRPTDEGSGLSLRLLDDGDPRHVSLTAPDHTGMKWGTGSRTPVPAVRAFAAELVAALTPEAGR